ncbi:MAG: vWA domain-containing protein [Bdellovibrio sp.]
MKASKLIVKLVMGCVVATLSSACAKMNFSPAPKKEDESSGSPNPVQPPAPSKTFSSTEVVAYGNKQVDFLLVLDDSNSMLPELKKLAAKMSTFMSSLDASNIDWQICLTTITPYEQGTNLIYGIPKDWSEYSPEPSVPQYLLKKGTANLNTIFTSTIEKLTIGGPNSSDERAIKVAHDNFANAKNNNCYRPGAAVSVIVISDEDERSVGGDVKNVKANENVSVYIPFEPEDQPQTLFSKTKEIFGENVRFTFSSIIVKPGDKSCEAEQDLDASPSHPGNTYAEMSKLTDGGIGSICDTDYSDNLNSFKEKIVNSLSTLILKCEPDPATLKVAIEDFPVAAYKLDGKTLKFPYAFIEGTKIDLSYDCKE